MPIKMSLGLTKKLGLPAYSSVGASCHVECEVDSSALEQDGQRFHQEAERLFGLSPDGPAEAMTLVLLVTPRLASSGCYGAEIGDCYRHVTRRVADSRYH
jgi:hypothetical protein